MYQQAKINKAVNEICNEVESYFVGDEMLVVNKNMHFFDDPKFIEIFDQLATSDHYRGMAYRIHNLIFSVSIAMRVEGDFVECGVFRGFKSLFLMKYFGDAISERKFYLFDTYEGIDESLSDGSPIKKQDHNKRRLYDFIKYRFREFNNAIPVMGSVPSILKQKNIEQVAFLHLDMNSYMAEVAALEELWDRMPAGAVVVLDDFGLKSHNMQMANELPWFLQRGERVLEFPTGQGLVIKG